MYTCNTHYEAALDGDSLYESEAVHDSEAYHDSDAYHDIEEYRDSEAQCSSEAHCEGDIIASEAEKQPGGNGYIIYFREVSSR